MFCIDQVLGEWFHYAYFHSIVSYELTTTYLHQIYHYIKMESTLQA
jgi:hypothetical protein